MLVYVVDGDGRMYLIHEIYRTQQSINWWVTRGQQIQQAYRPSSFECDPSEPGFISELRQAGLPAIAGFNGIALGIQAVQDRLQVAGDGRPRLIVYDGALSEVDPLIAPGKPRWSLEERPRYVWATGTNGRPTKEEPVDDNNHGMDAERYAVCAVDHIGKPAQGQPAAAAPRPVVDQARDRYRRYS